MIPGRNKYEYKGCLNLLGYLNGLTLSFIFVHSLQLIEKAGFLFFDMLKDAISHLYLAERLVIEFVLAADENIELCCPGNRFFLRSF